MSVLKSKYYAYPDGQDAFGKTVAINKYAVSAGLAWSTFDVLTLSKTKGYLATLGRYAYNTGPMVGMASAFALGSFAATNIRGKDDKLNYAIGGILSGGVFGAWKRTFVGGTFMALVFDLPIATLHLVILAELFMSLCWLKNYDEKQAFREPKLKFKFLLAIAGCVKKLSLEEGWEFFPPLKTHEISTLKPHDFTLIKDRPRNWTTGKEDTSA